MSRTKTTRAKWELVGKACARSLARLASRASSLLALRRVTFSACVWLCWSAGARAEQLPITVWTTADGLAHNHINRLRFDARGYLWICTDEGLSRFDGYQFINYTSAHGLPHRSLSHIIETRDGTYWLATDGGVCRFDPDGTPTPYQIGVAGVATVASVAGAPANRRPMFVVYRLGEREEANRVNSIVEDGDGALWCATNEGLFRLRRNGAQVNIELIEIGLPRHEYNGQHVSTIAIDPQGALWAGAISGLYVRWPDGSTRRFTTKDGLPDNFVQTLLLDRDGGLWGGTRRGGVCRFDAAPQAGQPLITRCYSTREGLAGNDVRQIFRAGDDRLWLATANGLSEMDGPRPVGWPANRPFISYTTTNGLSGLDIYKVTEDRAGNLWLGTRDDGIMRLARAGFVTYTEADGFRPGLHPRVFSGQTGEICIQNLHRQTSFQQFDGRRFRLIPPYLPNQVTVVGKPQLVWRDRRLRGLLPAWVDFHRLYTDAGGDLWLTAIAPDQIRPYRFESATGKLIALDQVSEFFRQAEPSAFCEDTTGQLWIGMSNKDGLLRYRQGAFTRFTIADGVPRGRIHALHMDRAGRLWIASAEGGLGRIDQPAAERPQITTLTSADGLSSDEILCLAEDEQGRIYAGINRGVDRLDPATGRIRHYTPADGLAKGAVWAAGRDGTGALWFVTTQAASRFIPTLDTAPPSALPVFINGVRAAGVQRLRTALGASVLPSLQLAPGENNLSIDFIGLDFNVGPALRYQYQLAGEDTDWSPPVEQRTVNYARLAPGRYRFAVRAVSAQGVVGDAPATFTFTILPPVWQRWWFVLLIALVVGLAFYALYHYRLARLLELERVRTRIATDLHDDIGVNLSLIAMVSELAQQQVRPQEEQMHGWLSLIADTAREMVDSMSDLVWAINPEKDRLNDLTQRMRHLAAGLFNARNIAYTFSAADQAKDLRLGVEMRREVFLIFKESAHNIVRHAECTTVEISFQVEGDWLCLTLRDNGRGFDPDNATRADVAGGNGLASMRRRARKLGGELEIISAPGRGTAVVLRVPLRGRGKAAEGRRREGKENKPTRYSPSDAPPRSE